MKRGPTYARHVGGNIAVKDVSKIDRDQTIANRKKVQTVW